MDPNKIFCIFIIFFLIVRAGNQYTFAASNSNLETENDLSYENNENNQQPILNEQVVNLLEKNNIDCHIEDGYIIKLNQPTPELIDHVNVLLANRINFESQQEIMSLAAAKTYPTDWVYMKQYDRTTSKKFTKATKIAFVTALTTWLTGLTGGAATLAKAAGAGVGGYYFVESDTEDIYTHMRYHYRELDPGKFTDTRSFMGDYQIKKVERVTKSSSNSGGQVNTRYKKSTIVEPFFLKIFYRK